MNSELTLYEQACHLLDVAETADALRGVISRLNAIRAYARRAKNRKLNVDAGESRLKAKRRLGEELIKLKIAGQIAKGRPWPSQSRITLATLDTSRNLSAECQRLAAVPPNQFENMLADWRRRALSGDGGRAFNAMVRERTREKAARRAEREAELGAFQRALPSKRYGVIYADPPWRFEPWSRTTGMDRAADNHYATNNVAMIERLDVNSIAADDCVLGLWATVPMLPQAIQVMAAWDLRYRTHFVWRKDKIGLGYWARNVHELLLIGSRGHVPCPAPGEQWQSVIDAPRGRHSEKPEVFLEFFERFYPNLPKIELYRRGPPRPGWDAYGLEVEDDADRRSA